MPLSDPALRSRPIRNMPFRSDANGLEHNQKSGQLTCYLNRTSLGAVNSREQWWRR
jgi:hypothetical protein